MNTLVLPAVIGLFAHVGVLVLQSVRALHDCRDSAFETRLRSLDTAAKKVVWRIWVNDLVFAATSHVMIGLAFSLPGSGAPWAVAALTRVQSCSSGAGASTWWNTPVWGVAVGSVGSSVVLGFRAYHGPLTPSNVPLPKWLGRFAWGGDRPSPEIARKVLLDKIRNLVGECDAQRQVLHDLTLSLVHMSPDKLRDRINTVLVGLHDAGLLQPLKDGTMPAVTEDLAQVEKILARVSEDPGDGDRIFYYEAAMQRVQWRGGMAAVLRVGSSVPPAEPKIVDLNSVERRTQIEPRHAQRRRDDVTAGAP
jgi:hypothetical protein